MKATKIEKDKKEGGERGGEKGREKNRPSHTNSVSSLTRRRPGRRNEWRKRKKRERGRRKKKKGKKGLGCPWCCLSAACPPLRRKRVVEGERKENAGFFPTPRPGKGGEREEKCPRPRPPLGERLFFERKGGRGKGGEKKKNYNSCSSCPRRPPTHGEKGGRASRGRSRSSVQTKKGGKKKKKKTTHGARQTSLLQLSVAGKKGKKRGRKKRRGESQNSRSRFFTYTLDLGLKGRERRCEEKKEGRQNLRRNRGSGLAAAFSRRVRKEERGTF